MLDLGVPVDEGHDYDPRYRKLGAVTSTNSWADDAVAHTRVTSDPAGQANAIEQALRLCLRDAAV
ncbi:hypothetical protein ACWEL8_09265 [Streptomyces sp. NPDC004690]